MNEQDETLIPLGKIGRPHGTRGEVRLFLYNPDSDTLEEGVAVVVHSEDGARRDLLISRIRYVDKFAIVKFKGLSHCDQVEILKHGELSVDAALLPELEEDEFYHVELLDLPVYVARGQGLEDLVEFGTVLRLFETGANDVMVVARHNGEELFVPMIEAAVLDINVEEERVVLHPLEQWAPADEDEEG
jgi:16S rRNA processing protein RimM